MAAIQESPESVEIRLLRDEFHQHRDDFRNHELQDESRHVLTTSSLLELTRANSDIKGFIRGRTAALGVFIAIIGLVVPFLTIAVSALFSPHPGVIP